MTKHVNAQPIDWNFSANSIQKQVSEFLVANRKLWWVMARETAGNEIEDAIQEFYAFMLDPQHARWNRFDEARGTLATFCKISARSFFDHYRTAQTRRNKRVATSEPAALDISRRFQSVEFGMAYEEAVKKLRIALTPTLRETWYAILRANGDNRRAAAMLDIEVSTLTARVRSIRAVMRRVGLAGLQSRNVA